MEVGIQADMDVSGRILHTWMPAIHAGMTKLSVFMFCGVRKIMNHFVVLVQPSNFGRTHHCGSIEEEKAAVRIRGQVRSHGEWVRKEVKKSLGR